VLVTGALRDLALGKGFAFEQRRPQPAKGFSELIRPFELVWQDQPRPPDAAQPASTGGG
jgi:hypothetical protein